MAVLAGIVTYNPDLKHLKNNIESIINSIDKLVVVDNNSENQKEIVRLIDFYSNATIVTNKYNLGVAKALNVIGEIAFNEKYDYFLTMDQDSIINKNSIESLLNTMIMKKNAGIVAPIIKRSGKEHFDSSKNRTVITSGNLVRTEAWKKIGGYWDYLFIDEVDHEFCYRLWEYEYQIVIDKKAVIVHMLGNPSQKKIFGHVFNPLNHSAFRRYYISRNCVIIGFLYPYEKYPYPNRKEMLFRTVISVLLCENDKIDKIRSIIKGIYDGKKWIRLYKKSKEKNYRKCGNLNECVTNPLKKK